METEETANLIEALSIIRLNAHIQRGMGKLFVSGKEVLCVALDRSCVFVGADQQQITLDDSQLFDLITQMHRFARQRYESL